MAQITTATQVIQVYTSNIERNPKQPRQWFNSEELEQLTTSVREHGITQPPIVCSSNANGIYTLIAAERAGLKTVPLIIGEVDFNEEYLIAGRARGRRGNNTRSRRRCIPCAPGTGNVTLPCR